MSADEDVIKLIYQSNGPEVMGQLSKSTGNYNGLLTALSLAYAKGEITTEEFLKKQRQYSAEIVRQSDLLERLKAAEQGAAAAADKHAESVVMQTSAVKKGGVDVGRA